MKTISTVMPREEAEEEAGAPKAAHMPKFSYGTCLNLSDELIDKLDLKGKLQVGQRYRIEGEVLVTGYRETTEQDDKTKCSADAQIVEFGLEPDKSQEREQDGYERTGRLLSPTR